MNFVEDTEDMSGGRRSQRSAFVKTPEMKCRPTEDTSHKGGEDEESCMFESEDGYIFATTRRLRREGNCLSSICFRAHVVKQRAYHWVADCADCGTILPSTSHVRLCTLYSILLVHITRSRRLSIFLSFD